MLITNLRGLTQTERYELGLPFDVYKQMPGLNPSTIKHGTKSMLHLKYAYENAGEATDAMNRGSMTHALLFEPSLIDEAFAIWEGGRRQGKEWEAFCADNEGRPILRRCDLDDVAASAVRAVEYPLVKRIVERCRAEISVFVNEGDMPCKCRLDCVSESACCLADLKTTTDITAEKFGRTFYRFQYDIQLGLYQRWWKKISGERLPVVLICLEQNPPYDCAVLTVPDAVLEAGVEKGLKIIDQVRAALESDDWPGVAAGEEYHLHVPAWEMPDDEISDEVRFDDE